MAGDDDIDWGGFDEHLKLPTPPAPPPADALALDLAVDEIKEAAAHADYDVTKYSVISPFECKDALKHLGCRWNADRKVWVARDAAMYTLAIEAVDKHLGRNSSRSMRQKIAQQRAQHGHAKAAAAAGVPQPVGVAITAAQPGSLVQVDLHGMHGRGQQWQWRMASKPIVMGQVLTVDDIDMSPEALPSAERPLLREPVQVPAVPAAGEQSVEEMCAHLRKRGYTVAKLGELETLAELLVDGDESDPFEALLEELE